MPPTTRHGSSSKTQAKLDFSPLPKDSVQAQQLTSSVRERASAVRYYSPKKAKAAPNTSVKLSAPKNDTKLKLRSDTKARQQKLELGQRSLRTNAKLPRIDGLSSADDRVYGSQLKSSPTKNLHSDFASSGFSNGRQVSGERVPESSPPDDGDSQDEDEVLLPVGTRSRPQIIIDDDDDDDDDEDLDIERTLSRNRRINRVSDDEESLILPETAAQNQVNGQGTAGLKDSDKENASTGSEDELVLPSSIKLPRRSAVLMIESDDEDEPISSSVRATKRLHSRSGQEQTSSSPTKKRRLQQGPKPRRKTREEQDEEVLEDAQDLQDTTTLDQGLRSASKLNEKKLARQRQLSKLAARRNKTGSTTIQSLSSSSEPEDLPLGKPYNDVYSDDNSSQADSLIDDGDLDAPSPASSTEEIRINRSIYDIPSALYYIIEQLLHSKFFPSAPKTPNSYYSAAHSLLSKRLESYANQYISSIWRKDFTAALHARPRLTWPRNELSLWDSCEACGRRDHPARYVMRFEGPCYDEWTLKSIDSDSNSTVFSRFDTQVPEHAVWHVGADCHDNAWRAHRATHWRFELSIQIDKALSMMNIDVKQPSDKPEKQRHPTKHHEKQTPSQHESESESESEQDEQDEPEAAKDPNQAAATLQNQDRFQAVLLQMEDQGYMQALQNEFLERFEMVDDEDEDED